MAIKSRRRFGGVSGSVSLVQLAVGGYFTSTILARLVYAGVPQAVSDCVPPSHEGGCVGCPWSRIIRVCFFFGVGKGGSQVPPRAGRPGSPSSVAEGTDSKVPPRHPPVPPGPSTWRRRVDVP